jgi:hypothetical protein
MGKEGTGSGQRDSARREDDAGRELALVEFETERKCGEGKRKKE